MALWHCLNVTLIKVNSLKDCEVYTCKIYLKINSPQFKRRQKHRKVHVWHFSIPFSLRPRWLKTRINQRRLDQLGSPGLTIANYFTIKLIETLKQFFKNLELLKNRSVDDRIFLPAKQLRTFFFSRDHDFDPHLLRALVRIEYKRTWSHGFKHQSSEASPTVNFIQQRWSRFWLCSSSVRSVSLRGFFSLAKADTSNF